MARTPIPEVDSSAATDVGPLRNSFLRHLADRKKRGKSPHGALAERRRRARISAMRNERRPRPDGSKATMRADDTPPVTSDRPLFWYG